MHWLSAGSEILRVQDCSRRTSTNCTPSQWTKGLNFLENIPFATTVISPRYGQYKWTRARSTGSDAALRATVTPKVTGHTRVRIKMSAKGALQKASTAIGYVDTKCPRAFIEGDRQRKAGILQYAGCCLAKG